VIDNLNKLHDFPKTYAAEKCLQILRQVVACRQRLFLQMASGAENRPGLVT